MATETVERTYGGRASEGNSLDRASRFPRNVSAEQVARGLGWFSLGLGLAEILLPGKVSWLTGAKSRHPLLMRLMGFREIAAGAVILSGARTAGCWSRVAGDAIDL